MAKYEDIYIGSAETVEPAPGFRVCEAYINLTKHQADIDAASFETQEGDRLVKIQIAKRKNPKPDTKPLWVKVSVRKEDGPAGDVVG